MLRRFDIMVLLHHVSTGKLYHVHIWFRKWLVACYVPLKPIDIIHHGHHCFRKWLVACYCARHQAIYWLWHCFYFKIVCEADDFYISIFYVLGQFVSLRTNGSPNIEEFKMQTSGNPPVLSPRPEKTVADWWKPLYCCSSCRTCPVKIPVGGGPLWGLWCWTKI